MPGPGAVPILVVGYVVVEVMGGLRPGSLSLLTDAVQMFVNAPRLRAGQATLLRWITSEEGLMGGAYAFRRWKVEGRLNDHRFR